MIAGFSYSQIGSVDDVDAEPKMRQPRRSEQQGATLGTRSCAMNCTSRVRDVEFICSAVASELALLRWLASRTTQRQA